MSENGNSPRKFGAFLGVFTPTVLTILGVIMYLRLGFVVGNAGLWGALAIIAFSNVITFITAMSMSTLATNMRVGVGGAYFLISRSFGLEVGGAIGIPLYLSQVLSVTLYAYGLAESLRVVFPNLPVMPVAALIVVGVTAVAARSTALALKLQLPIMAFIAFSIVSLMLGVDFGKTDVPAFGPWTEASPMFTFAIFFPAVTGILTGLSLSGDLEDPGTAIPRGGLAAVAVGAVVYMTLPFFLAHGASAEALRSDPLVWTSIAAVPLLVMPGMWGAVLSSAFGAVLSAPRTLQALATDKLAPERFSKTDEETGEPLIGLYFSGGLALLAVLLGDLNAVANVVTMFFLTTYGALNGVACLESLIGDPSFRPRIRLAWWISLIGFLGCFLAMFAINPGACFLAMMIEAGIFYGLSRRSLEATWGDARGGLLLTGARAALMRLRDARFDPRNWRPHILVFTTNLARSIPVIRAANDFGQHRGIVTVCHLVEGGEDALDDAERIQQADAELLRDAELSDVFSEVDVVRDLDQGMVTIAQANGIAGLHSNTVMFGYVPGDDDISQLARLMTLARRMEKLHRCTLVYVPTSRPPRPTPEGRRKPKKVVMMWWAGRQHNGDLMLLLAHLMTVARAWRGARIILKSVAASEQEALMRRREFEKMLPEIRMDVEVDIVIRGEGDDTVDIIRSQSEVADFVFLGLRVPDAGDEKAYAERITELLEGMPDTCLVRNAGRFSGRLV